MFLLALQMNPNDPAFWVMVVIALSFIIIAVAMVAIAVFVSRAVKSVNRLEQKLEQFTAVSGHLSAATMNLSESLAIIRDEVGELKEMVSETAHQARDKVELVSRTIDRTHNQVVTTTDFIQTKVVEPARELAAIMAGFRRGLEVLVAPMPKPINQTYGEDEMFIG